MIFTAEEDQIEEIRYQTDGQSMGFTLGFLADRFPGAVTFSTSFSLEDQVVTHEIASSSLPIRIFTLDTGRLFSETYSVWEQTRSRYNIAISPFYPATAPLETFIGIKGPNAFYESVENRKACCYIRKVEPLNRALTGYKVWITGLRAEHSPARNDMKMFEWDAQNRLIKYNPLLNWTSSQVRAFVQAHNIPYNSLHDKGYISIGCAPCTRAVRPGEDFRAGRWWWEEEGKKECGLHLHQS